jgi:CTP:phosphocholine cytidylyltransferase-like protein
LDIDAEFSRLANAINLKVNKEVINTNISRSREEVLIYLSSKNNWLLVFDNNIAKQNHKISDFVNWDNNGHIIFASQDRESLPHVINVDTFSKQDSMILANNLIEEQNSDLTAFIIEEFKGGC